MIDVFISTSQTGYSVFVHRSMKLLIFVTLFLCPVFFYSAWSQQENPLQLDADNRQLSTLLRVKQAVTQNDPEFIPAVRRLRVEAAEALQKGTWSVVTKKLTPPSGNKHETSYALQVATYALFVGKPQLAKQELEKHFKKRIIYMVEPDGRQPRELARTKSLSYSLFNLRLC